MEELLVNIINEMAEYLSIPQMKKLQEVLVKFLSNGEAAHSSNTTNEEYLTMFLNAKKLEGCSDRTISYYRVTVKHFFSTISTPLRKICTDEIRQYLVDYQSLNNCSKITLCLKPYLLFTPEFCFPCKFLSASIGTHRRHELDDCPNCASKRAGSLPLITYGSNSGS